MKEVIVFLLSGREYGVDVNKMQGCENLAEVTKVANMPESILGTVTIRDEIIPVMDIKKKLIVPRTELSENSRFVVFRTMYGKIACIADGVSSIFRAGDNEVQNIPALIHNDGTDYADCVVKKDNVLILVVNPEKLLTEQDWTEVKKQLKVINDEIERKKKEELERIRKEQEKAKAEAEAKKEAEAKTAENLGGKNE